MIHHIVIWNFKEELSAQEKQTSAIRIKEELEALIGVINDVVSINVIIDTLSSSNCDIMLNSLFETIEDLNAYQVNPHHNLVVKFIKNVTTNRNCIDYISE